MKAEAVNATSRCLEHARLQVKMVADVDENLQEENIMSPGQRLKQEAEGSAWPGLEDSTFFCLT